MRLLLFVSVVMVLISGCSAPKTQVPVNEIQRDVVQDSSLRNLLDEFQDRFQLMTGSAAGKIQATSPVRQVQRNAILWKIRSTTIIRDAISQNNASTALIEAWVSCLRIFLYFNEGDGTALFKEQQPLAVQTAQAALDAIESIAAQYVKSGEMDTTRNILIAYSRKHPLKGVFEEVESSPPSLDQKLWKGLASALTLPILPFTAPVKLRESAREFTDVGQRWGDIVEDLPREVRWQAELLMADMHEVNAVRNFLDTAERISQTAARLTAVVEDINKNTELKAEQAAAPIMANVKTVTDHIARRIAQLVVLVFILAAILILLARRSRKKD